MRHVRLRRAAVATTAAALVASALTLAGPTGPSIAVNADHGDQVVSADPANFTPHVMNGSVKAITQVGNRIIVAGSFTRVSPAGTYDDPSDDVRRNRIFAFDATTGAIDPRFNPNLGGGANSLATQGRNVYVAGSFRSVGGNSAYKRVVKLTDAGSLVRSFRAVPNDVVHDVVVRGSRVYIGGAFTRVTSRKTTQRRLALAALRRSTGAVLRSVNVPFTGVYHRGLRRGGVTNVKHFDVTANGSRLVAVGNFSTVGGRRNAQVAVLNTRGVARVSRWHTNRFDRAHNTCRSVIDTFMRDVDFSPRGNYFVITTTGAFGGGAAVHSMCDTTSRWETNSRGNNPTWINYTGGDTTFGVAITGSAVYVGGHMRWQNNPFRGGHAGPGAVPRSGIAALDPVNGLPLSWNPGRTRGVGAQAMYATRQGLWVGSDTSRIGNETHGRIALMPLDGGTRVPAVRAATLPDDLFVTQSGHALDRYSLEASGVNGTATTVDNSIDWSALRGAFLVNDTLYYGRDDGNFYRRSFNPETGATGAQQQVDLYDDPQSGARIPFRVADLTGAFYDPRTHRLYYTVDGDRRLLYRYFTPESSIVGAQGFQADAGGVDFSATAGMTLAGGRIFYGSSGDGKLRSVPFAGGRVTGRSSVVAADGSWRHSALFVPNG